MADSRLTSSQRHASTACEQCRALLDIGQEIVQCGRCGRLHHAACFDKQGGCGSYECAPSNRSERGAHGEADSQLEGGRPAVLSQAPELIITFAELKHAGVSSPRGMGGAGVAQLSGVGLLVNGAARISKLAIAGCLLSVAGLGLSLVGYSVIELFGIGLSGVVLAGLVTGVIGAVCGIVAAGAIRAGRRRGAWLAGIAIMLGLADVAGSSFTGLRGENFGGGVWGSRPAEINISKESLDATSPAIGGALRANVVLKTTAGWSALWGSGIVLRIDPRGAVVLTNRHVVDGAYKSRLRGRARRDDSDEQLNKTINECGPVTVGYVDEMQVQGRVVWLAPGGVDAALIVAPASESAFAAAVADAPGELRIGEEVFAIGNPRGLGWSYTRGAISALRTIDWAASSLDVVQSSAPTSPGNSGGGLYRANGELIGMSTWAADRNYGEGLSLAIAWRSLLPLLPAWATDESMEVP